MIRCPSRKVLRLVFTESKVSFWPPHKRRPMEFVGRSGRALESFLAVQKSWHESNIHNINAWTATSKKSFKDALRGPLRFYYPLTLIKTNPDYKEFCRGSSCRPKMPRRLAQPEPAEPCAAGLDLIGVHAKLPFSPMVLWQDQWCGGPGCGFKFSLEFELAK